jgi:signal peptidase I
MAEESIMKEPAAEPERKESEVEPGRSRSRKSAGDKGKKGRGKKVRARDNKVRDVERKPPSLLEDILFLLAKIAMIGIVLVVVFTFFFGIVQIHDNAMEPALRDGDLVLYYRLQKNYVQSDLITIIDKGKTTVRRVVALEKDRVDINAANGLEINGYPQQEQQILGETLPVKKGTKFSVVVGPQQVFVLGDNREYSVDSRSYGCVDKADTHGRVITVIRRRNL